jgi:AAA family ATP:ADP antiporter
MIYHLSDVTHSAYVKSSLSQHSDLMNKYFNYINLYLGIFAVAFSWFLSGFFIRRFGLKVSLLVTPIIWGLLSIFDLIATFSTQTGYMWHGMQVPLNLISLSILLSVGRAIKFTLFDTSQQMSFLSLDHQKKRLGKAAIDGLSSRFGKSGGAWLLIMITSQFSGKVIASLLPIKAVIFSCYILWFYATFTLIRHLPDEVSEKKQEKSQSLIGDQVAMPV